MKKNILVVQSITLFPLILSSSLSGMDIKDLHGSDLFKKQQELHKNAYNENAPIETNPIETSERATIELIENETITLPLPETKMISANQNAVSIDIDPLSQSIMLPAEEKSLSWSGYLGYKLSTSYQHLQKMIGYLKNDQFDTTDLTHIKWLNEAITTATANKEIDLLLTIGDLCENKYANKIRISEEVAQPAAELIKTYYTAEVSRTNAQLYEERKHQIQKWNIATAACTKAIHDQVIAYNENMNKISNAYTASEKQQIEHINDLQRKLTTFSILNKDIRPDTITTLEKNQLKTPKHIFAATMTETEKRLNSFKKIVDDIPTIKELQGTPTYLLSDK